MVFGIGDITHINASLHISGVASEVIPDNLSIAAMLNPRFLEGGTILGLTAMSLRHFEGLLCSGRWGKNAVSWNSSHRGRIRA